LPFCLRILACSVSSTRGHHALSRKRLSAVVLAACLNRAACGTCDC
jgi:hypothetical protein